MSGPMLTATIAPIADSSHPFHPANSSSNLDLLSRHAQPPPPLMTVGAQHPTPSQRTNPSLLAFEVPSLDFDCDFDHDFDPTLPLAHALKVSANEKITIVQDKSRPEVLGPGKDKMGGRRKALLARSHSWISSSKPTSNARSSTEVKAKEEENAEDNSDSRVEGRDEESSGASDSNLTGKSRSVSGSIASFAKRGWMSTSRSPSPSPTSTREAADYVSHREQSRERSASSSSGKLTKFSRKRPVSTIEVDGGKSSARFSTIITKMKPRPQSVFLKSSLNDDADSASSSVASLAPASTSTRPSNAASENSNTTAPDDLRRSSNVYPVRDPLWSIFRNLESEYTKFMGKTPQAKMSLVRTVLVPFLRNYASHPANKKIRSEDFENRANILDKWWKGLLEMLDARSPSQAVPGGERETLHEVTTLVMMRPEWRYCTPSFRPLEDRDPRESLKHKTERIDDGSGSGADSDYITESAEHNVRNLFKANLLTQMAIVVEKLSQRQVPPSLVNFAGKTCAYAFFFAPNVADVLVRLWSLTPNLIRRVSDAFNLPRYKGELDDIVAFFPSNMETLRWKSVHDMSTSLRKAPNGLLTARIAWYGPWLSKWRGRDSDLFFIFCKYYFVLSEEFIPSELPLVEKARAPGFVLVSAQVLATLDSTVHRQASMGAMAQGPPLADALHGTDASATQLPIMPNNNAMKGMGDNRLIVLLKDFLSTSSVALAEARHTFAETFMALMKASAKRTSQFDHDACFTLCDFLQQSLVAYDSFVDIHKPDLEYIDWPFWFEVWKKILESRSTISEVRVLCLIHMLWDAITSDPARKESICLDWLLSEEWFNKLFNSYSPMVRAFYMRLLCWRICRDTGSANELDTEIFIAASNRLKTTWSHYLWLKQEAEKHGQLPPPTAPCLPTPGRRFTIHCLQLPGLQTGLMMGFDAFSKSLTMPEHASSGTITTSEDQTSNKKWRLLGKVLSLGPTSNSNDLETLRRETAAARKPPPPPKEAGRTVTPPASDSDSFGSNPTFETSRRIFKFTLLCLPPNTLPLASRILTRPRLPLPAQARVSMKTRGRSGSPPPPEAGRPPATRAVSGSANMGLVEGAKNADPTEVPPTLHKISSAVDRRDSFSPTSPTVKSDDGHPQLPDIKMSLSEPILAVPSFEPVVRPLKPEGISASSARYAGQALAEWSIVVSECNNFVDRRREEGVLGLSEIEVPILEVEGFRKPG